MAKTAQKLKMDHAQLTKRISEFSLQDETTLIRNECREEILEKYSFLQKLDLALTKEKYLQDLNIDSEVDESLRNEINNHLDSLPQDASGEDKTNLLREVLSLDNQRLKRLVKRFELTEVVQLEQETAEVFSKQSQSV